MNQTKKLLADLRSLGRAATSNHREYNRLPYGATDWVIGGAGDLFLNICFGDRPAYGTGIPFHEIMMSRIPAEAELVAALVEKGWTAWTPVESLGSCFQHPAGGVYCRAA